MGVGMDIKLDGDGVWPDLHTRSVIRIQHGQTLKVAVIAGGMSGGAPSVAVRIDLPDGQTVIADTSMALWLTAADAMKARYGDPRGKRK